MPHNSESLRRAFRYFYPHELSLLKAVVYMVQDSPCVVVNVGAGAGTSGLAFLETRSDIILHTIDITETDSPFGCLYAERQVCEAAGYELGEYWFQHHGDSKQLAATWTEPISYILIDGDHEYEGATGDITGWLPHIRKGGYIAVHDYRKGDIIPVEDGPHPMVWEGVDKAVDELLKPHYECVGYVESLIVFRIE